MRIALLLSTVAALAGGVPGWAYGTKPTAYGRYLDFAFEGLGDGAHPWEISYHAPCDGEDRGTDAGESFSIHSLPHEQPLRVRHGRFVLRRHYDINGWDIRFTLAGHRAGKRL